MISRRSFGFFGGAKKAVEKATGGASQPYDVLIVGGGPAGLALASSLGSSSHLKSLKIGLIEANSLDGVRHWSSDAYSNRCSSISAANFEYLQRTGALSSLDTSRISPITNMQVWDGRTDARITFGRQLDDEDYGAVDKGGSTLSYMIENSNLQKALLHYIENHTSIDILESSKISSIDRDNEWPRVSLHSGDSHRTRLLIGADGFNSPVRKFAEIDSVGWAYDAAGFVSTLETQPNTSTSHASHTAFQRFLPTGPIAYLPLPGTAASMVWSTTPQLAKQFKQADARVLTMLINAAFRFREDILTTLYNNASLPYDSFVLLVKQLESAQGIDMTTARCISDGAAEGVPPSDYDAFPPLVTSIQEGSQASFPLKINHTDGYDANRAVLVGDAAHSCHPLAGQGLNLGLADVQSLTSVLAEGRRLGGDIGSKTVLSRYTRDRYVANMMMLGATDKLNALFQVGADNPLVQLRSVGLETLNEMDFVKDFFMRQAGTTYGASQGTPEKSIIADTIQGVGSTITMVSATARQLTALGQSKVTQLLEDANKR
ncbi:hypothetical protein E3P99_02442 [Wallemia hederae]|uniref:Ubiquinone biosynthesis monooxygenase COQ6, mitochondrial n=1 Tax=Wallemia hederae TaxID=1540922 RepID=A0A4T0FJJ7_9BASI|nr:hypothetical protein E3P99_02442 [Wallemia hederae]